jgi:hypothetical protein
MAVGSLLLFGATACADLDVSNPNDADAGRALLTAGDVESLVSGSLNSWFNGISAYAGPGMFLSNAAFQHNAPWANSGMEHYGRIPRIGIQNDAADANYANMIRPWYFSYRAIAAVADGLRALENDPDLAEDLGADDTARLKAFGRFVQGMSHATLALFFDRGFLVTEATDPTEAQEPMDYNALMTEAFSLLDEAAQIAGANDFEIPSNWMPNVGTFSSADLVPVIHAYKARFRAQVARTSEERAAVNWQAVMADIDAAGFTSDYILHYDWNNAWEAEVMGYATYFGWSQLAYWVYGMADQSGNYQAWINTPLGDKTHNLANGDPVLIHTPDLRFPQGASVAEQRENPGTHYRQTTSAEEGGVWAQPGRGTWRWSWYKARIYEDYWEVDAFDQPEITLAELQLLKAEGLYRTGDMAGAAAIINETRVPAGLNATDASGANSSCVPKLPDGSCGDLWEILKWEKRMEAVFTGIASVNWFWDGRGWGDLFKDTYLQFPIPCLELQTLQLLPCTSFGGPGGDGGSPGSTYNYPDEN